MYIKGNRTREHRTVIKNSSFFLTYYFAKGYFGVVKVSGIRM